MILKQFGDLNGRHFMYLFF